MRLRHTLCGLLAALTLIGASCIEPGPNNPRTKVHLFVLGDSWAQGAGNANGTPIPGVTIPGTDPVVPEYFRSGHNKVKPSFNTTINFQANTNPNTYYATDTFSSWGFGGTRAAGWVAGDICAPGNVHPADPGCSYLDEANRSLPYGDMMIAELEAVPTEDRALVYVSLGVNDIKDEAYIRDPETGVFDLNNKADREIATTKLQQHLTTLVSRLTAVGPNVEVIIAGYTPFRVDGSVAGAQCQDLWDLLMPGTTVEQSTLTGFVTGIGNDPVTQGASLRDVFNNVASGNSRVFFADVPNSINPGNVGAPPPVNKWGDCLHLNAAGFDLHASAVFESWAAQTT